MLLIVNVASRCGFTPQYEALEQLQRTYGERGFTVLGFPSNQFLQELGSEDDIKEYCSTTWGVTFPMFEKVTAQRQEGRIRCSPSSPRPPDADGEAGKVKWNFEKFLVLPSGEVHRFRTQVKPDDPQLVALIEANLPA